VPEARHAVATLATLLETPACLAPAAEPAAPDEALVFVGAREAAPASAAAVIEVRDWPKWSARTLVATKLGGVALPAPPGTPETSDSTCSRRVAAVDRMASAARRVRRRARSVGLRRRAFTARGHRPAGPSLVNLRPARSARGRAPLRRRARLERDPAGRTGRSSPCWRPACQRGKLSRTLIPRELAAVRRRAGLVRCAGLTARARAPTAGRARSVLDVQRWMAEEERRTPFSAARTPRAAHEYDPLIA
jgi:hypothetical protein